MGQKSPKMMNFEALSANNTMTWLLRLGTFIMLLVGIALLMQPIVVLADVIPFLGTLVGIGTGMISFLGALILWSIATAIAWFVVRPVGAVGLVACMVVLCILILRGKKTG